MSQSLWVHLSDRRVARLDSDRGRLSLHYDTAEGPALSVRLPVRDEPYADSDCRAFFANLLPEGAWRLALSRQLGISPDDDFALLAAVGGDCAGAVAVRPEPDWTPERGRYTETSEAELARWVKNPAARPKGEIQPGLRLSLAGAQDKLLVHLHGETPYLCENGAPSSVILKPDIRDPYNAIALTALNELCSMRLAAAANVRVPDTFWYAAAFATRRYDRFERDERWQRLHQEDFAQVLGLPAVAKYEVAWTQCFELVTRYTTIPAKARLELLDRLLFNLLLGNNDAHAKNFALLHVASGRVELAPAYDLVCTQLYPSLSASFAMPIGPAKNVQQLSREGWTTLARQIRIGFPFIRDRAAELTQKVSEQLEGLYENVARPRSTLGRDVYPARRRQQLCQSLAKVVRANCRAVKASFV